jgi:hypothetical protein
VGGVRRFRVWPHYAQVEISDAADDVDYPQWETGAEQVLVSAQCIVLATQSDLKGDVEIEVRLDTGGKRWLLGSSSSTENCSPPVRGSRSATR